MTRTPGRRRLTIGLAIAAVIIAAIATVAPSSTAAGGRASASAAADYITARRLDLGTPGLAVGVVTESEQVSRSAGDLSPTTPMPVGSVTKSFTALAVMQLAEAGVLALDSPVVAYLARFTTADPSNSREITVRELLSHTSGIPTRAGLSPLSEPATTLSAQVAALSRVHTGRPGQFAYSNANYLVLGELVERVSGQSYAAYVRQHILAPLDMTHTYTDLASARAAGLRPGHRIWFGVGVPTGTFYRADFLPAGFLISTGSDLQHYVAALLDDGAFRGRRVLSTAGVHALFESAAPGIVFGTPGGYGLGWFQRPTAGLSLDIDPGIAQNVHADLVLDRVHHVGVVLLADGESDLYLASIPKIDLAAMNAALIAGQGAPASGLVEGLYLIFDLVVVGSVLWYARSLARVLKRRVRGYPRPVWRIAIAVWREVLIPVGIVVELPAVYSEPWSYLLTGDVGLSAALIAGLGIATFLVRTANAIRLVHYASGHRAVLAKESS